MNGRDKVAIFTSCVSIAISIVRIVATHKAEIAKREHIRLEHEKDLAALEFAKEEVYKNIDKGEYDGKGLPAAVSDIKFYQIVHRTEKG